MSGRSVILAYLHGFASDPGSTKAQFFRARLAQEGIALEIPDLAPDFTHMTMTGMLGIVEAILARGPAVLLGSSLGGYLAALAAARHPDRVRGLVLFAPAFGFGARWEARIGPAALARWRAEGTAPVHHYGLGRHRRSSTPAATTRRCRSRRSSTSCARGPGGSSWCTTPGTN